MQEGNGDVLFGTSVLGGFNRRNVLNYIGQLQNRMAESDAAAEEKLRCAQRETQSLEDALSRALAEKQSLEISLSRAQKENDMLRGQLNDARDELLRLRDAKAGAVRRGRK